jgi:hypothetical protein
MLRQSLRRPKETPIEEVTAAVYPNIRSPIVFGEDDFYFQSSYLHYKFDLTIARKP